jgi:hypothetical protein
MVASCAQVIPSKRTISESNAIALAKKVVVENHIKLPPGYTIRITKDVKIEEPGIKPIYWVHFDITRKGQVETAYSVAVNRRTCAIEMAYDPRKVEPVFPE